MELLIKRLWKTDSYSGGKLWINGKYFSFTIEDADRGLSDNMDVKDILKVKKQNITAIPTGRYQVAMTYSNRFKRYMPQVLGVKGFEGIRIHVANKATDVEGCIGLAYEDSSDGFAGNSRTACIEFEKQIKLIERKEKIWLTIE
jgi:hypothetical protein